MSSIKIPNVMHDNFFAVFAVSSSFDFIASIKKDGNVKAQTAAIRIKTIPNIYSHPYQESF